MNSTFKDLDNIEVEGIDHGDAPKFCDAFIASATWASTGKELTEDELEEINEDRDLVHYAVHKYLY